MDPFVIYVAVLRRVVGTVVNEHLVGPFDPEGLFGPTAMSTSRIVADAEMSMDITLQSASKAIALTGTARAPWCGLCSRCALEVHGDLTVPLEELFVEKVGDDDDVYRIVDDAIDVGPAGREALIVGLPLLPLCRPDCQGLCPTCGIDKNEATCSCAPPRDDRWSALDGLGSGESRDA
jgi:uncharacterized protein